MLQMRNVSFIILILEIFKVLLSISMGTFHLLSCSGQSFQHIQKKGVFSKKHFLVEVNLNSLFLFFLKQQSLFFALQQEFIVYELYTPFNSHRCPAIIQFLNIAVNHVFQALSLILEAGLALPFMLKSLRVKHLSELNN